MKKIADVLLLTFVFFVVLAEAQQNSDWVRVESENKEISFSVPSNFSLVFDKEGFSRSNPRKLTEHFDYKNIRSITAYQNGVTMFFESYDVKNSKKALPNFLYDYPQSKYQNISFENFSGLEIILKYSSHTVLYYLASEKNTYLIGVGARETTNETISRFLKTIKLNGKFVFEPTAERLNESDKILPITDLQETPIEVVYNLTGKTKEKRKKDDNVSDEINKSEMGNSKELIVLFKPRPMYTDRARQEAEKGIVRFQVSLSAEGKIGKIIVNKDLRYGLTENAIRALKRMRFIPAEKDNISVSSEKYIEYSFSIY